MVQLYKYLPTIDLHGYDRDYARIMINDFIEEQYKLKNYKVIIIHGNGTGIIKKVTQETLRKNKKVENYKIDNFNTGMTIVSIKRICWHLGHFMLV